MSDLRPFLATVADGNALSRADAAAAFDVMMAGEATAAQIGGFLMALRVRGETVDEIAGAVSTMRARMTTVDAPANAIDIVGTGGDGAKTYNVSTCAAIVTAACGVPVAKHGNRALSSASGTADALEALGIHLSADPAHIARCVREAGLGFMFAPNHHAAMRHVGPSRVELATRTVFNLLGPLSNPAGVKRQLVGVFSAQWVEPLAHVLGELGTERAWIVHGDGLDEMTVCGTTQVAELANGSVRTFTVEPEDAGLDRHVLEDIRGGDATVNARALRDVLEGARNAYRDIVVLNAAGALVVAGKADDLAAGARTAEAAIDAGQALGVLERLVAVSNEGAA